MISKQEYSKQRIKLENDIEPLFEKIINNNKHIKDDLMKIKIQLINFSMNIQYNLPEKEYVDKYYNDIKNMEE